MSGSAWFGGFRKFSIHRSERASSHARTAAILWPPGTADRYVYLDEDWLGINPSKRYQRPICRGEWREMASIIKGNRP
jgi:hypothetical protein